jgi:CDP-6-deoxy-D-xylo-4-hexulose-3-dehydrase
VYDRLKKLFTDNGIEHRPIVSGNLMTQPFLSEYKLAINRGQYNVNKLDIGVYIGNNHFVNRKDFDILKEVLESL